MSALDEQIRTYIEAIASPVSLDELVERHVPRQRRPVAVAALAILVLVIGAAVAVALQPGGDTSRRVSVGAPIRAPRELVALTSDFRVVRMNTTGKISETIAKGWGVTRGLPAMSVSPDGTTLYMEVTRPTTTRDCRPPGSVTEEIVAIALHGNKPTRVVAQGRWPAVSPDGQFLAWATRSTPTAPNSCDPTGITVRNLETGAERHWAYSATASQDGGLLSSLSWAPDSRHLAFAWLERTASIHVLDTRSSGPLSDSPTTPIPEDISWAGYDGATGDFLAVREPTHSGGRYTIVALDPSSGETTREILDLRGTPSDGNALDKVADGIAASGSGRELLISETESPGGRNDSLYRWSARRPVERLVALDIVAAVWIPVGH